MLMDQGARDQVVRCQPPYSQSEGPSCATNVFEEENSGDNMVLTSMFYVYACIGSVTRRRLCIEGSKQIVS